MNDTGIKESGCPVCGRVFAMTCSENWTYKRTPKYRGTKVYYCSYGCMLAADRDAEQTAKKIESERAQIKGTRAHQRKARYDRGAKIDEMKKSGMSFDEIAAVMGVTVGTVRRIHGTYRADKKNNVWGD